jgi:hypothetical protein
MEASIDLVNRNAGLSPPLAQKLRMTSVDVTMLILDHEITAGTFHGIPILCSMMVVSHMTSGCAIMAKMATRIIRLIVAP